MLTSDMIQHFAHQPVGRRLHYEQLRREHAQACVLQKAITRAFNSGVYATLFLEVDSLICPIGTKLRSDPGQDGEALMQFFGDWVTGRRWKTLHDIEEMERIWPDLASSEIGPVPGGAEN